jgi:hypothetical protein
MSALDVVYQYIVVEGCVDCVSVCVCVLNRQNDMYM